MVREAIKQDLMNLLELYLHLHETRIPEQDSRLDYAKKIAEREDCTRLMLMTGSKKPETHKFYENAGYNSEDKTAFVQWLGAPGKRNKDN